MKKRFIPLALLSAVLLAGCNMAPKYSQPKAPVPAAWPTGPAYDKAPSTNAPQGADLKWEEYFTDEKLRQIIAMAIANNRDLRIASLNVERARGFYGIRRTELWPTMDAVGRGSVARLPGDLSNSNKPQRNERWDVNLGVASWEIDFFGRIRNLKDRALEEFLATEHARRSVNILIVSSVAQAYLALAADRENLAISENTLQAQQALYDLIKRRHELGLLPELELFRAQTPLEIARRDVATYTQQVAMDENALNLLAGATVPKELQPDNLSSLTPPASIGAGVSSEVLLLRPDVQQAESLLRAANADIGAARAAFFPRISLSTLIGTASADLSGLFQAGSGTWSYAPQIVMPIFDARTWSAHKVAKVQRQIAVRQYEGAIQSAFREVADALAVRGTVGQQLAAQQTLLKATAETYRLANARFHRGIDSYLTVLDAQRSLYAAEQGVVALRLAELASQINLYAVLGGGWEKAHVPVRTAYQEWASSKRK